MLAFTNLYTAGSRQSQHPSTEGDLPQSSLLKGPEVVVYNMIIPGGWKYIPLPLRRRFALEHFALGRHVSPKDQPICPLVAQQSAGFLYTPGTISAPAWTPFLGFWPVSTKVIQDFTPISNPGKRT